MLHTLKHKGIIISIRNIEHYFLTTNCSDIKTIKKMPKKAGKVDFLQPEGHKISCHTWELERITRKCTIVKNECMILSTYTIPTRLTS